MDALTTGMTIDIKRTDGRIHEAVISGLNEATRSVTVEWFEKGETKGKEVELAAIVSVNPGLLPSESNDKRKSTNGLDCTADKETKAKSAADKQNNNSNDMVSSKTAKSPHRRTLAAPCNLLAPPSRLPQSKGRRSPSPHSSRSLSPLSPTDEELLSDDDPTPQFSKTLNPLETTSLYAKKPSAVQQQQQQAAGNRQTKSVSAAKTGGGGSGSKLPKAPGANKHNRTVFASQLDQSKLIDENTAPALGTRHATSYNNVAKKAEQDAASKRKSVTVQEIERLKKNREDRRAQQEELRRQKDEQKNIDPGNPNWEFLNMVREYQAALDFKPLRGDDKVRDSRICVCIRKRPLNKKEFTRKEIDVVTIPNKDHTIVHQPQTKVDLTKYLENQKFRFDYAFNDEVDNEMVYRFTAQPLVRTIFEQGFATCFAYGQTGSGKTHTMGGDFDGKEQDCTRGIYALTAKDVFKMMDKKDHRKELYVSCTFFEIYGGKVFDLLNNKAKLRVLEDGKKEVQIVGLTERTCSNDNDVLKMIAKGTDSRTAGQTSANNNSSRSHAVFQILLRKKNTQKIFGKFSLIDLAGNERGVDTMSSDRQTRMEGAEINKSLLALKECIRAMAHNNPHLPFRASKLTLVLRDSFVGSNSRTCMIAMVSPGMNSCEHTLNTLRYADRVKELRSDGDEQLANGVSDDVSSAGGTAQSDDDSEDHDSDQDLALVQSRNADDLSDDLYNFQLAVNHVQDAEESAIDEHTKYLEAIEKAAKRLSRLLKTTERVDYDLEAYAAEASDLLEHMPNPKHFAAAVSNLQREMAKEQEVVQKSSAKRNR